MNVNKCSKDKIYILGLIGSTNENGEWINHLWEKFNANYAKVEKYAKKAGNLKSVSLWGAMTSFNNDFSPWEDDLSKGLYMASIEVEEDTPMVEGFVKWIIPAFEYIYIEVTEYIETLNFGLNYLEEKGLELVGAIQEYYYPIEDKMYLYFPIKKL